MDDFQIKKEIENLFFQYKSLFDDETCEAIEHYIDHEVRIRLLEHLAKQINNKMNIGLTLIAGSLVIPVVLKWLGWL
jgi:hypothetical protein